MKQREQIDRLQHYRISRKFVGPLMMYLSEYKNTWYLFLSRLQDWRCLWCRACVHSTCRGSYVQHCSLGETRPYTVPPTCLIEEGASYILGVIHKLLLTRFCPLLTTYLYPLLTFVMEILYKLQFIRGKSAFRLIPLEFPVPSSKVF